MGELCGDPDKLFGRQPAVLGAVAVDQLINQIHRGERGIPQLQQTLSVEGRLLEPLPAPKAAVVTSAAR